MSPRAARAAAERLTAARDRYRRREAAGGALRGFYAWRAGACERARLRALLVTYRADDRTPAWVPTDPVRVVRRNR